MAIKLHHRRDHARIEANAEQRRREDATTRLCDEIPTLETLRFHFEDQRQSGDLTAMAYSKPIVVKSAPASFEIRCMEPRCDGRHDLSREILNALRKNLTTYAGKNACDGVVGEIGCNRVLSYTFVATYSS